MFEFLKLKLEKFSFQTELFKERRLVYFAEYSGDDDGTEDDMSVAEKEALEIAEKAKQKNKEQEPKVEELAPEVDSVISNIAEKSYSLLDKMQYEMPPDVDPKKIDEARKIVDSRIAEIDEEKKNNRTVNEFLELIGKSGDEALKEQVWTVLFNAIPEIRDIKIKKHVTAGDIPAMIGMKISLPLKKIWKKNSEVPFSSRKFNAVYQEMLKDIERIAEIEMELFQAVNEGQEMLWDMYNVLQKREIEERALKAAETYTGLSLKKDQLMIGFKRDINNWHGDQPETVRRPAKWRVVDVYVDSKRPDDEWWRNLPESTPEEKQEKERAKESRVFGGVWVEVEDAGTGQKHQMSMRRFKEFASLHRLKPQVNKKKDLPNVVDYLKTMNINLQAGMTIEFDEWVLNKTTQRLEPQPNQVKIRYIDDEVVQLDKPIKVFSLYDSPDDLDIQMKDRIPLAEFAQWLNKTKPLPVTDKPNLQQQLQNHYEYMNNLYKRIPECHRPINLEKGEVIFADAPGNPLFEISNVGFNGDVDLTNGKHFTGVQFLRWVYKFDMEPYDPELEAMKVKKYVKQKRIDKKFLETLDQAAERAKQDAENTIKHFQETGTWRDTLKKLRAKGMKGILEPKIPLKEDVYNDAQKQSHSWMRQFINDTHILRVGDVIQLFTKCWEYRVRNYERQQKARYSAVGKGIPWFGTEFERISQQAETEEMQQFKDAMDQWGVRQVEETLYATTNRDQAKACFNVLAEKGYIRWDDPRLWKAINQFTDINHKIPIPKEGVDPYMPFAKGTSARTGQFFNGNPIDEKSPVDFIPEALDSLWGETSYVSWKRQNDSALEDGIQKSFNKGEELESDPNNTGGIAKELAVLLERHMRGEYVEPSEFEGLLRFCIEMGKAGGKEKMYYLLMGTSAKSPDGRSIMGWDRVGRFISKYSNQFAALDYFSQSNLAPKRDFRTGEVFTRKWLRSDFDQLTEPWENEIKQNGGKVTGPTAESNLFLWNEVLNSDSFQIRLEKGIRNAQNIDHDDSPYFIPALKESEIQSACATTGGDTKKFTVQGYKNGYIGFGLRLKSLEAKIESEKEYEKKGEVGFSRQYLKKMVDTLRSYMRYDAILDNRYLRKNDRLQKFNNSDYNTGCVWDGERALRIYQTEMNGVLQEIIRAYGRENDENLYKFPFIRQKSIKGNKEMEKNQEKIENAIENWGPEFEEMVMSDDGEKMIKILQNKKFKAQELSELKQEDKIKNKMKMELFESSRGPSDE